MSKEKKPFSETKIGKFIKEKVQPVAGDVLEFVGDVTGIEAIDKVGEFLNKRKDENAEIAKLHQEFELKRMEFELELEKVDLQYATLNQEDRGNARAREVALAQAGAKDTWLMPTLALSAVVGFFGVVFYVLRTGISNMTPEGSFLAGILITAVASRYQSIYEYYFGGSASSKRNGDAVRMIATKKSE